ncbi:MAG TPA: alpha/beta hydrolase [Stellaceae bacterium]|nr:alpha/beta hydrolase [Stellaceae bacterium]
MTTLAQTFTTQDLEYARHDGKPLLLRFFRPAGKGPFPVVVDIHGGAWSSGDRLQEHFRHEALAEGGLAVAALDFRHAREGAYPTGVADINYAVRWVKAHAKDLEIDANHVGAAGQSSGGHLAMLVAMKPRDPRYAAQPLAGSSVDASLRCVAMSWPVINPLSRYHWAKVETARGAEWAAGPIEGHDKFWQTEANMADGSCILALERGDKVETPPAMWIQVPKDPQHNYKDPEGKYPGNEPERFCDAYRKAGGTIDLLYFDAPQRFTSVAPTSPAARDAFQRLTAFFKKHLAAG